MNTKINERNNHEKEISNGSSRDDRLVDIFLGKFPAKEEFQKSMHQRTRHPSDEQGRGSNLNIGRSRNYRDASGLY